MTKLSEVLEDLKRASRLGAEIHFCAFGKEIYAFEEYDFHEPETFELSRFDECLIVDSLEQYAKSEGYWFNFERKLGGNEKASIWRGQEEVTFEGERFYYPEEIAAHEAPTRLQAALKCFLEVFGR
jgi:hypothetical protein